MIQLIVFQEFLLFSLYDEDKSISFTYKEKGYVTVLLFSELSTEITTC